MPSAVIDPRGYCPSNNSEPLIQKLSPQKENMQVFLNDTHLLIFVDFYFACHTPLESSIITR